MDNFCTVKYWGNYLDWPHGLQTAMKCLIDLHADVKENHGVKTLMGSHTDQNCAESGFGQIRGMGAANNDPNAQELLQRVSRWTTHRILKYDPDFNIMTLKEPLEKYIQDFCTDYYEEDDEFDEDMIPDDLTLEREVSDIQGNASEEPEQAEQPEQPELPEQIRNEDGKDIYR